MSRFGLDCSLTFFAVRLRLALDAEVLIFFVGQLLPVASLSAHDHEVTAWASPGDRNIKS